MQTNLIDVSLVLTSELGDKAIDIIPLQFCIYQLQRNISPALHVMTLHYCKKVNALTGLLGEAINICINL